MATLLQIVFIGALISRSGSKKIGINTWNQNKKEDLVFIEELFEAGKVTPVIDRRYTLSKTAEALRYLEEGHHLGKLVITMEHITQT